MTFPPPPALAPRMHAGWLTLVAATGDGGWHPLPELVAAVLASTDLQERSVRKLLTDAKRNGWCRWKPDPDGVRGRDWLLRFDHERCTVCESPRSLQEARTDPLAVDDAVAAFVGRVRAAEGREAWLDAMALAGLVAATEPIEPEELAEAAREFRGIDEERMKVAVRLLEEIGLIELDVSDPNAVRYKIAD